MDINPITSPKAVATTAPVAPAPPAVDTKVPTIAALDRSATALAQKPFIAPIVNAKLAASSFSEKDLTSQAPERVLRPYGVPMLPYQDDAAPTKASSENSAVEIAPANVFSHAAQEPKIA